MGGEQRSASEPEAYGVYLRHDGRFMDIAAGSKDDAVSMAEVHYETDDYEIRPLYASAEAASRWIRTTDRLPEKPGKEDYEHVECLVRRKGRIYVALWNCEHLCWDDDDGDDFRWHATDPSHWMPLPGVDD